MDTLRITLRRQTLFRSAHFAALLLLFGWFASWFGWMEIWFVSFFGPRRNHRNRRGGKENLWSCLLEGLHRYPQEGAMNCAINTMHYKGREMLLQSRKDGERVPGHFVSSFMPFPISRICRSRYCLEFTKWVISDSAVVILDCSSFVSSLMVAIRNLLTPINKNDEIGNDSSNSTRRTFFLRVGTCERLKGDHSIPSKLIPTSSSHVAVIAVVSPP